MNAVNRHEVVTWLWAGTLLMSLCWPADATDRLPLIEVFIDSTQTATAGGDGATIYHIDRVARLQHRLSEGLPADPELAKQRVLERLQHVDASVSAELEHAAQGLLLAVQYGLDRYPAVIFDGRAVVYGVTDLSEALSHYRRWQGEAALP